MSTPHTLPPARFDSRIDSIYAKNQLTLTSDPTPITSLCGGATDMMIPSESCVLPVNATSELPRRTVFTSALEGAWTGVGHREMVWCHQVRWRVARAALEAASAISARTRAAILDKWLRDGHTLPPAVSEEGTSFTLTDPQKYTVMEENENLVVMTRYLRGTSTFLLPLPSNTEEDVKGVVHVGLGSILSVGPHKALPLKVSVYMCTETEAGPECASLPPSLLKLVPNPRHGRKFPLPDEGADESEGTVVFEADIPAVGGDNPPRRWLGIQTRDGNGRGWVVGGIAKRDALLVYKYTPIIPEEESWCSDPVLTPLISHTSQPAETHYFPVNPTTSRILLHTHSSAPYVASVVPRRGFNFVLYSSGTIGCNMLGFKIGIDWSATFGRWASRYPTTLVTWAVGIVALIHFTAWGVADGGGAMPSVGESLSYYGRHTLKPLLLASFAVALLPLPVSLYTGTVGNPYFAAIAPLLLLIASGLVCVIWGVLILLVWPIGAITSMIFKSSTISERAGVRRSTLISMGLIFALIFVFVPWQVAFLGCWLIHLFNCANSAQQLSRLRYAPGATAIPLIRVPDSDGVVEESTSVELRNHEAQDGSLHKYRLDNHNHNMHLLLLMTWLLPLVAPVLAVWVRTLFTAGLTTPFDGDHDFLNAAPFLILVDFASWNTERLFERQR
ncbi:hypothetical protein H0H92_011123 [Tricholoma furcatifolium]|nr:hypothetical protein H0H92_011123 [Tricholoma furcatifolium]